jgi:hypothetical protein
MNLMKITSKGQALSFNLLASSIFQLAASAPSTASFGTAEVTVSNWPYQL